MFFYFREHYVLFFKILFNYIDKQGFLLFNIIKNYHLLPQILLLKLISYMMVLPLALFIIYIFSYDLNTYGHLSELSRIAVGPFNKENSLMLGNLHEIS